MTKIPCAFLAFGLFTSVGATYAFSSQLMIGFAEGFVSDGPELLTCGELVFAEISSFRSALSDLRKGLLPLNVTEIEKALDELKELVENVPATEQTCKMVAKDVGTILGAIKQIKGPKDLIVHVVRHLVGDGERIFGELAAADKAYKTGWDFMTAGQNIGMAVRRMVIGEGSDGPPAPPAPAGAKKEVFDGVVMGFISDNLDFVNCSQDARNEKQDFAYAVKDFELGLRHLNLTDISLAIKEFDLFVKGVKVTKEECKLAVSAVESDVKALISALRHVHGPRDLVRNLIHNVMSFGVDIFGDLSRAAEAYGAAQYMGAGREVGMALRRVLLGEPNVTSIPSFEDRIIIV